ncbi:MAG: hypothetical protein AAFN41_04125 [Planctomycetota bacterium]
MTHSKTGLWTIALVAVLGAASSLSQQVEYVTRNVQPTHAVRFNSSPLRITITDRGIRQPLASSPISKKHYKHGTFKHSRFGHNRFGQGRFHRHLARIGGGVIIIREGHGVVREPERASRTVYGKGHPRHPDNLKKNAESAKTGADSDAAARERHARRVLAMIQAQKRLNGPKAASHGGR